MRGNLDSNPPYIVQYPERILRKGKGRLQAGTSQIQISLSLSKGEITSLENTFPKLMFEHLFLRTKSKIDLDKANFDEGKFQYY